MALDENIILKEVISIGKELQEVKDSVKSMDTKFVDFIKYNTDQILELKIKVNIVEKKVFDLEEYKKSLEELRSRGKKILSFAWVQLGFKKLLENLFSWIIGMAIILLSGYSLDKLIHHEPQRVNVEATINTKGSKHEVE